MRELVERRFRDYSVQSVGEECSSRVLVVIWKTTLFFMSIQENTKFWMTLKVENLRDNTLFWIINVYGMLSNRDKVQFWEQF